MVEDKRDSTQTPLTRFRRIAGWLPLALILTSLLIVTSGVRFAAFPEPILVARSNRVDEYSWETLIALVLATVGSLGMALTIKFDELARPETVMFRRGGRWVAWIVGIGGWIGVWRLARILLGKSSPP